MQIIKSPYSKTLAGISLVVGLVVVIAVVALEQEESIDKAVMNVSEQEAEVASVTAESSAINLSVPSDADESLIEKKDDPFEGREVKYRFQQIAAQFAEDIQYPNFSRPIKDEYDLIQYKPNRAVQSSRPINLDDEDGELAEDGPRISLKTSKFKYYQGEPVIADATISGLSDGDSVNIDATVRSGRTILAKAAEISSQHSSEDHGFEGHSSEGHSSEGAGSRQFTLRFDDLSQHVDDGQGDLQVVAEFKVGGNSYFITSLIRYPNTVASLERVGDAYVDNEYLLIPMHVKTSTPGLHSIKANLYNAENNQALIHLNAVERLTSEEGVLLLKAHIAALKKMGHEGPYEIRDISLTRGASAPNYTIEQGLVEVSSYPVTGFSFNEYEDIEYIDERAQARLEFLTKLGSIN